ncbi:hypothetical protein KEM54_000915 [Ascosphaera aggregata]|nr:hypothetical protein KEM54_000915 [Ascosphaera aggregata]
MSSGTLLHDKFGDALHRFHTSLKNFEILETIDISEHQLLESPSDSKLVYVLDSSFNPPTLAHLSMAVTALQHHLVRDYQHGKSARLLLLLATQNADKPSMPASFEDRLVMMHLFALKLRARTMRDATPTITTPHAIDIGVTNLPFFTDKAKAISTSGVYAPPLKQTYLMGFDTLIRVFDPKYYPGRKLTPLSNFFVSNKILLTLRSDDKWGTVAQQRQYIEAIGNGSLNPQGGDACWADHIDITEGTNAEGNPVSSTKVRQAARAGSREVMDKMLIAEICEYVLQRQLYAE